MNGCFHITSSVVKLCCPHHGPSTTFLIFSSNAVYDDVLLRVRVVGGRQGARVTSRVVHDPRHDAIFFLIHVLAGDGCFEVL